MKNERKLFEYLTSDSVLVSQPLALQPVVEIAGDHRVLIENHFGVKEYSRERITVKMQYGLLCVCGCRLEIVRMTKVQLVICGKINSVALQRRDGK